MTWEGDRAVGERVILRCPVCGAQTVGGAICGYHRRQLRTAYHREYYWANAEKRRQQRIESKQRVRASKKIEALIRDLNYAVDLGRLSATW